MKKILFITALISIRISALIAQTPVTVNQKSTTRHGPEKGSLLIIGGNVGSTYSVWSKFVELAGGKG